MSDNKFILQLKGTQTPKSVVEIKNDKLVAPLTNVPHSTDIVGGIIDDKDSSAVVAKSAQNWKLDGGSLTVASVLSGDGGDYTGEYSVSGSGLWVDATYTFPSTGDPKHPVAEIFNPSTKWVLKLCGKNLLTSSGDTVELTLVVKIGVSNITSKTFTVAEGANAFCRKFVIDFSESEQALIKAQGGAKLTLQLLCSDDGASATIYNGMTILTALQRRVDASAVSSSFANVEEVLHGGFLPNEYFSNTEFIDEIEDGEQAYAVFERDGDNVDLAGWTPKDNVATIDKIIVKSATIPTASADLLGAVYQYVGQTGGAYEHGYIYECVAQTETLIMFDPVGTGKLGFDYANHSVYELFERIAAIETTFNAEDVATGSFRLDKVNELWYISGYDSNGNALFTDFTVEATGGEYCLDGYGYIYTFPFPDDYEDGHTENYRIQESHSGYAWERIDVQPVTEVIDSLTSTSTTVALSANQGKVLNDRIDDVSGRGRFLSLWNCATGLAESNPPTSPYVYKAGDYFVVGTVSSATPAVNYKPDGSSYTTGVPSTTVETELVDLDDTYIYDGTNWVLQYNSQKEVAFSAIAGDIYDNTSATIALNAKANSADLATVATTGSYDDLIDTPGIMTGASVVDAGISGLVPAPAAGDQQKFLQGDGTWTTPTVGTTSWGNISGTIANQADLQNELNAKANTNLSNLTSTGKNISNWSSNVSNCITESPQDIKLELNAGTLTLKAGSKVYVPNGSGVFDTYTLPSDLSTSSANGYLWFLNNAKTGLAGGMLANCYSGTTEPTGANGVFWYDTTNNIVKRHNGSSWVSGFSLPIGITDSSGNLKAFNGFGFVGSNIFALPGIKGLTPDGRNADGTLKTSSFEITSVQTVGLIVGWNYRWSLYLAQNNRFLHPTELHLTSNTKPTAPAATAYWWCPKDNILYYTSDTGATWSAVNRIKAVDVITDSSAQIKSLNSKTAFQAVDYSDTSVDFVVASQLPTSANNYTWYRKYKSGWVEQGQKINTQNTSFTFPVPMADTSYMIIGVGFTISNQGAQNISTVTTTGFSTSSTQHNSYTGSWMVIGMAA